MSILIKILLVIHVFVSLFIILLVLMQRPKNEGLGAAFGGGMTDNLFGAQTTNVLQTVTRWLGGIFFSLTLFLSWLYVRQTTATSDVQRNLSAPTVPAATPAPASGSSEPSPIPTNPTVTSPPVQVPPQDDVPPPVPVPDTPPTPESAPPMPAPAAATPAPAAPR
jgi:preprotein translocase subunit SecG